MIISDVGTCSNKRNNFQTNQKVVENKYLFKGIVVNIQTWKMFIKIETQKK